MSESKVGMPSLQFDHRLTLEVTVQENKTEVESAAAEQVAGT